jgi:hypothetical protein
MVGMGMGHENAIEPGRACHEQLLAQIRRRIDQDNRALVTCKTLDQNGAAPAPIF